MGRRLGPCFVALLLLSGCLTASDASADAEFRLGTTTSMRDSGLLDILVKEFESLHGIDVEYVAVGTGAALNLGANGDVDALIVHAPDQEEAFIAQGHGVNRTQIAWNAFVLLSPVELPDGLLDTFTFIAEEEHCFVSRGDNSGTHMKEQAVWEQVANMSSVELVHDINGLHPEGDWYYSIGQGMGATINMADEKQCITLTDRGTALQFQPKIDLVRYEFNDTLVHNPYAYLPVTGGNEEASTHFLHYLLNEGQQTIATYTINGEPAFYV